MTTVNLKGDSPTRALEFIKRDPMIRALLVKQPEDIIAWLGTATVQQRADLFDRIVLLVAGLARGVDFK